jgi:glycosyltransferase involved in cell wall biosynthesis
MHILHIIGTIDTRAGGPADVVRALLAFSPEGYTGEVATFDDPASPSVLEYPFRIHAFGPQRSAYGYNPRLSAWLAQHWMDYDGVIVHGLWQYCGLAACRAFHGRRPYMVFSHGMLDPYFKRQFPRKHLKKWAYWLVAEYWVLRGAFRVLFTTAEEGRLATQSFWLHRWTGHVVPFGASRAPASDTQLREAFYQAFPQLRGLRYLLFLGRIHRKKGCDLLIEAFVRHAALDPALHLVMAGPDQQCWAAELKTKVVAAGLGDRVHWPGMLDGEVKWGSLVAAEVFILPSHQENFGIAVAEALGCGIPVLLADKVNIAAEIAADGAGLMELDTQDGTDRLVKRWIDMPEAERAAMRTQARRTFAERYDISRNAEKILRLFETSKTA